ncbi:hypothetical protein JHU04_001088 [Brenneria sp. 4F2]|nr:hypothetical protein [Brenneria bubanii]
MPDRNRFTPEEQKEIAESIERNGMKKLLLVAMLGLSFDILATETVGNFSDGNDLNQWIKASKRIDQGTESPSDYLDDSRLIGYTTAIFDVGSRADLICTQKFQMVLR